MTYLKFVALTPGTFDVQNFSNSITIGRVQFVSNLNGYVFALSGLGITLDADREAEISAFLSSLNVNINLSGKVNSLQGPGVIPGINERL